MDRCKQTPLTGHQQELGGPSGRGFGADFTSKWTPFDQQHVLRVAVAAAKSKNGLGMCRVKGPVVHKSDWLPHLRVDHNARPVSPPSAAVDGPTGTWCPPSFPRMPFVHALPAFWRRTHREKFSWVSLRFTVGRDYVHIDLIKVAPCCFIVNWVHVTRETDACLSLGERHRR